MRVTGSPLSKLGALPPLSAQILGAAPHAANRGEEGAEEGEAEADTTVVPEVDAAALLRTLAEAQGPSEAPTVLGLPTDEHTSILDEADLQPSSEHTSILSETDLHAASEPPRGAFGSSDDHTSILSETDLHAASEPPRGTFRPPPDDHTSILSETDLHAASEPPRAASGPGDDHTSILTEGDLELGTASMPPEGTSILAEEDLDFDAVPASQARGKDYESYSMLDPRALLLGRAFGGFRIVREMASGGMASVFLARKDGPGRVSQHAAIKVVHPHLSCQSGFVDMFLDEARIVSCVNHPNVCRVLDFGTAEGTYYLAMEYVLGETWAALQSALAADEVGKNALPAISAFVIAQAAEGLHAAHEASDDKGESLHIVHRDVSPQNIFVAYDGTVRVLDFGIARAADRITTTQAGTVKGRLAYMAPEQMEGRPLDRRADIWSLGVVLREALENRRLFRKGSDAETMLAVTTEPLPEWQGMVSPKLREIVDKALERDLDQRYLTAHHLSGDLMRFCRSQASPVSMPEVSSWMHRLFKHKLEEKRLMLQEKAPEPRTGETGPLQPWRSAPSTQGFTPSAGTGSAQANAPSGSHSTHSTHEHVAERPSMMAPVNRTLAGVLLFAVVAGGAGAGVWFARSAGKKQFAETPLAPATNTAAASAPSAAQASPEAAANAEPKPAEQAAAPMSPEPSAPSEPAPSEATPSASSDNPKAIAAAEARALRRAERAAAREAREREAKEKEGASRPSTGASASAPSPTVQGPPGTILVAYTGGWAEVYLGKKLLGTTPGRFTLPAGKHTLTIKPFGTGDPEQRTVEITSGGTSKLAISPH